MASGHLIYHWKHGWIPLTHAAALSKAHGSASGAEKYVPGAGHHHQSLSTHGKSAREIHASLAPHSSTPHPVGSHVVAKQPGIDTATRGVVVGHVGGMVQVAHKDHRGDTKVGRFNPSHVTPSEQATHAPAGPSEVAKLKDGDRARVTGMDQFGQPITFHGIVQGKPTPVQIKHGPTGKPEPHLAVSMHNGSDASGGDATARTAVYVKTADHANVASLDAKRAQDAAAGKVVLTGNERYSITTGQRLPDAPSSARPAASDRMAATAQHVRAQQSGSAVLAARDAFAEKHRDTPTAELRRLRQSSAPGSAEQLGADKELNRRKAAQIDNPAAARRTKILAEADAIGQERLNARRAMTNSLAESRRAAADSTPQPVSAAADASSARVQVEHSGDGTLLSIGRDDVEARNAAKAAGFKWSRNLGSWYLPRTWSEPTRRQKVTMLQAKLGHENVHLADSGPGSTTTAAERESAARAHAAERAGQMDARAKRAATEADVRFGRARAIGDMIPFGQPILVGHHSEGRHRRDLAKIDTNMRAGFEADQASKDAAAAADRARATAAGDSPLTRQRRIDRNEAEARKIDRMLQDHGIAIKAPAAAARVGMHPLTPGHHASLTAQRARLADEIQHDKAQMAASGHQTIQQADISPGDLIHYRGRPHIVAKVNKTTVSVPTGYSWHDKVPINQITKHQPLSKMSDGTLQAAAKAATDPKIRARFIHELNRRGITLGNH